MHNTRYSTSNSESYTHSHYSFIHQSMGGPQQANSPHKNMIPHVHLLSAFPTIALFQPLYFPTIVLFAHPARSQHTNFLFVPHSYGPIRQYHIHTHSRTINIGLHTSIRQPHSQIALLCTQIFDTTNFVPVFVHIYLPITCTILDQP